MQPSQDRTRESVPGPFNNVPLSHLSSTGLAGVPQQLLADISASHRQLTRVSHRHTPTDDAPLRTMDSALEPPISGRAPANTASQRAVLANLAVQQVNSGILSIHPTIPVFTSTARATGQYAASGDEDGRQRTLNRPIVESVADLHSL